MLRDALLALSRSDRVRDLITTMPLSSGVVARYVPGDTSGDAVDVVAELVKDGREASLDFLGEDVHEPEHADETVAAYLDVLEELAARGLAGPTEVSVKLSAVGQALPHHGERVALDNARTICRAARNAGTMVTLDMEDHTTIDSTLRILREVRQDFPETGAVLQAYLFRTEQDCHDLATQGSRVRLCKGAYDEPEAVAHQSRIEVDLAFVRCLKILMNGAGYPMVASHDPRMVEIAGELARRADRAPGDYEYQMLYGIRPDEQRRLAAAGERVRVYVPYGQEWYGYLMRRLAERPSNLTFFLRSLASKK